MDLHVTLDGPGDLAARIYRQLRDAVLDGRLRSGERLPPTRDLAQRLKVSRNTVATAYERLTAEGFVVSRVGAGTFVGGGSVVPSRVPAAPAGSQVRPRRLFQTLPTVERPAILPYDFSVGVPDGRLFPMEAWRRLVVRELRGDSGHYSDAAGHPGLRSAIARYVGVSRSVRASPDDVLVTRGAQQALDLIGRVLIDPGTCVAVEEPGYEPARLLFTSLGARVVGVPVDSDGIVVSAIPTSARLVYTTPSHQYPLGLPLSVARRSALLDWAQRHRAVVIEDDYDSEFRFSERPLEPLQSLDRTGRVIYVGSFSKTMLPMLRTGFLVAPASLRTPLRVAKQLTDWYGDVPSQAALAHFLDDGMFARHIRKATREYAARQALILSVLKRDFADWLRPVPSTAGLHLCALVTESTVDIPTVARRAADRGVRVASLSAHYAFGAPAIDGLVIGYGAIPCDEIAEGLRRLASCFPSRDRADTSRRS